MEDAMTPTVAELEKKAHEALGQVVNGCYEYQFDRDVDLVHAAIRDLAAAKVEGGGHETFTIADNAIDLFLEYRDKHGYDETTAKAKALCEFMDAARCSHAAPSETRAAHVLLDELAHLCDDGRVGLGSPEYYNHVRDIHRAIAQDVADAAQPQGGGVDVNKLHAVFDDLLSHLSMSDRTWGPFLAKTEEMREAINALKGGGVDAGKVRESIQLIEAALNSSGLMSADDISHLVAARSLLEQALAAGKEPK